MHVNSKDFSTYIKCAYSATNRSFYPLSKSYFINWLEGWGKDFFVDCHCLGGLSVCYDCDKCMSCTINNSCNAVWLDYKIRTAKDVQWFSKPLIQMFYVAKKRERGRGGGEISHLTSPISTSIFRCFCRSLNIITTHICKEISKTIRI